MFVSKNRNSGADMTQGKLIATVFLTLTLAAGFACSKQDKAPDVTSNIRRNLDQAGLTDVSVSEDRDKGVVTLTGEAASDDRKAQAETIAKAEAGSLVVADEIAVRAPGDDTAKTVDSDLDKGIDKNLDAMLVQHRLNHDVNYDVKNGVVTLKGNVPSESRRVSAEKLAKQVPNVKQVINELEVKNRKATSTQ
jgi:hyperosmotically inducible protein